MITATKPKWRKCRAMWLKIDHYLRRGVPTHADGVILGNLAVIRAWNDGRKYPWNIVHQPSGKTLCTTRTRRIARELVESLAERFDLGVIDRHAAEEYGEPADRETLGEIKDIIRNTPGVS